MKVAPKPLPKPVALGAPPSAVVMAPEIPLGADSAEYIAGRLARRDIKAGRTDRGVAFYLEKAKIIVAERDAAIAEKEAARAAHLKAEAEMKTYCESVETDLDVSVIGLRRAYVDLDLLEVEGYTEDDLHLILDKGLVYNDVHDYLDNNYVTHAELRELPPLCILNNGGADVAYQLSVGAKNRLSVGVAVTICNPKDFYSRLDGRTRCLERFEGGKVLESDIANFPMSGYQWSEVIRTYKEVFTDLFPTGQVAHATGVQIKEN